MMSESHIDSDIKVLRLTGEDDFPFDRNSFKSLRAEDWHFLILHVKTSVPRRRTREE
jgi:hypothetical protein